MPFRVDDTRAYSHLVRPDGLITLVGFGSLVSRASAEQSFALTNFRLGTVRGFRRVWSQASWVNISWGDAREETGEVCSLALAAAPREVVCRVALMEVTAKEGLEGFLRREALYDILQVPYEDDAGVAGVALACGESSDAQAAAAWGADNWYLRRCAGRVFYSVPPAPGRRAPLTPEVQLPSGELVPGDAGAWRELSPARRGAPVYALPAGRDYVYPAPGYLRMVYRSHARAGLVDNFLDTALLMDRETTLREYLAGNPLLEAWVTDPAVHRDRACDRYEE
jgi:hypothetical protein